MVEKKISRAGSDWPCNLRIRSCIWRMKIWYLRGSPSNCWSCVSARESWQRTMTCANSFRSLDLSLWAGADGWDSETVGSTRGVGRGDPETKVHPEEVDTGAPGTCAHGEYAYPDEAGPRNTGAVEANDDRPAVTGDETGKTQGDGEWDPETRGDTMWPLDKAGPRNFFFYHGFADLLRHIRCPNLVIHTPLSLFAWSAIFTGYSYRGCDQNWRQSKLAVTTANWNWQ